MHSLKFITFQESIDLEYRLVGILDPSLFFHAVMLKSDQHPEQRLDHTTPKIEPAIDRSKQHGPAVNQSFKIII
jgi:hypothetical protein